MIGCCFKAIDTQELCDLFNFLATKAINNSGFPLVIFQEANQLLFSFLFRPHFIVEISAIERRDKNIRLFHLKIFLDVELNLGSGSRGQGDNCHISQLCDHGFDLAVFRTEVMAPLGNTVGFIDGYE